MLFRSYLLRFRSGASTRSLVSFCDSVREHQPGVSYLPTIPFGSINPESHIFLRFRSGASTRNLVSSYDSIGEHLPRVSYLPTIPFGSINLKSRIFLRFRSGASTRSLVPSYNSVREHQPGVSYFSYDSIRDVTIFRIKVLEENSKKKSLFAVVSDKMYVFCLYPILDSQ